MAPLNFQGYDNVVFLKVDSKLIVNISDSWMCIHADEAERQKSETVQRASELGS